MGLLLFACRVFASVVMRLRFHAPQARSFYLKDSAIRNGWALEDITSLSLSMVVNPTRVVILVVNERLEQ